jgi:hypothetical protein
MVNGKRSRVAAHWEFLAPVEGAFVKSDVELQPEAFRPPTPANNPVWICIKSQCEEGGLMEFEDFWNPPQPPPDYCDNNENNNNRTQSPLHSPLPQEGAKIGEVAKLLERMDAIGKTCLVRQIGGTPQNPVADWFEATLISQPSPPVQTGWIFELLNGHCVSIFDEDDWTVICG